MRHKTHILEEKSFNEIERVFPEEWVVRRKGKDYGIDLEVEIFDKTGQPVNLIFWIQLKATSSKLHPTQSSISMKITKLNQLANYEIPVAIFRYCEHGNFFYFDWIKRHAAFASNSNAESFKIKFSKDQIWKSISVEDVVKDLFLLSKYRINGVSFPLKTTIHTNDKNLSMKNALSSKLREHQNFFKIIREKRQAELEIVLSDLRVIVIIGLYRSVSFGWSDNQEDSFGEAQNSFNLTFVMLLKDIGQINLFRNYVLNNEMLEDILQDSKLLAELGPSLIESESDNYFLEKIMERIHYTKDDSSEMSLQMLIALRYSKIPFDAKTMFYYEKSFKLFSDEDLSKILAKKYKNYANYWQSHGILDKALKYLNLARKTDDSVLNIPSYRRELGGVLFDLGRYKCSAVNYKNALRLAPDDIRMLANYADALMYSGQYSKALKNFDTFLTENSKLEEAKRFDDYEFQLKFSLLNHLVYDLEIKQQLRLTLDNEKFILASNHDFSETEEKELLKFDALSPYIWNVISKIRFKQKNEHGFFISKLFGAVIFKDDSLSWVHCALLTTYPNFPIQFLFYIVNTAFFYCGESFLLKMEEILKDKEFDDFKSIDFLATCEKMIRDPKTTPIEVRFWVGDEREIFYISD